MTLGRFTQADTIVPNPGDPQSLNRYSYVRNNPINLIDRTGHDDCAPEDDGCWEKRYYEAHGQCYSERTDNYSKSCTPTFADADILKEVLGEDGGMGIVSKANPLEVLPLLLKAAADLAWDNRPNALTLGIVGSGSMGIFYGGVSLTYVFDFKHTQIGLFAGMTGPAYGLGSWNNGRVSLTGGFQFGVSWCGVNCTSIASFAGGSVGAGASGITPAGWGLGMDGSFSVGSSGKIDSTIVSSLSFSALGGTPGVERHTVASGSVFALVGDYKGNRQAMAMATTLIVTGVTNNTSLGIQYGMYANYVPYSPPSGP